MRPVAESGSLEPSRTRAGRRPAGKQVALKRSGGTAPIWLGIVASVICSSSACELSTFRKPEPVEVHPTAQNVPQSDELAATISLADPPPPGDAAHLTNLLLTASEVWRVGAKGALHEPAVFADIVDAALSDEGRLTVIEGRVNEVRQFARAGSAAAVLTGLPATTGHFRRLASVVSYPGGIVVSDRSLDKARRLVVLRSVGDTFVVGASIPANGAADDMCAVGNELFVRSRDGEEVIQQYDLTSGRRIKAFGTSYIATAELVRHRLSEGRLACVDQENVSVVEAAAAFPYLYGYDRVGRRRWAVRINDFEIQVLKTRLTTQGATSLIRALSTPFDRISALVGLVGTPFVVVQTQRYDPGRAGLAGSPRTYAIDARRGNGWFVSSELPPLLSASDSHLLYEISKPYTAVVVKAWRHSGGSDAE